MDGKLKHILAAMGLTVCGCANTKSENIKTSGFYASYEIDGDNTGSVTCRATYQVSSGGTSITLSDGDTVTCNGIPMSGNTLAGLTTYTAVVSYSPGSTYTVTLTRAGEAPYVATVGLPAAISVSSPAAGAMVHKGVPFVSSWGPSADAGDGLSVSFRGSPSATEAGSPCPVDLTESSGPPESGSLNWANNASGFAGTCTATLSFTRSRTGNMPAGLSGRIESRQDTSVTFSLVD